MNACRSRARIPPRRAHPVELGVTPVSGAADLAGTVAAVTTAGLQRVILPGEAAKLARVEIFVRAVETSASEERPRDLEEAHAARA
ncbi:MAG: hypothetical protein JO096_10475 [Alphaproteobacteria bacterium]|nr:hypothetical protein [Alphaproteobacteria bacterium]